MLLFVAYFSLLLNFRTKAFRKEKKYLYLFHAYLQYVNWNSIKDMLALITFFVYQLSIYKSNFPLCQVFIKRPTAVAVDLCGN